jgi:predicted phage tail protein
VTVKLLACRNPFTPTDRELIELEPGATIRECLHRAGMDDGMPAIVSINGEWKLQAEWERPIPDECNVVALRVVAGGKNLGTWVSVGMIVAGIVLVATGYGAGAGVALIAGGVVGLASSLLIPTPRVPSSLQFESGSPTYSLDVTNRRRIGEPIPVLYGRSRIVPDLIANPYTEYDTNDQYLYLVLCLGNGEFNIEEVRVAESAVTRLTNFTSQTVAPGGTLTLFPDNVSTSSLVQGQLLRPTNDITRLGNSRVTITAAPQRITSIDDPVLFSSVSVADTITLTNCANAGSRAVTAVDAGGSWVEVASGLVNESPLAAGVSYVSGGPSIPLIVAGNVTFTAGSKTISDPTAKRFNRWKPGDSVTISNTTSNNQTVTLATVATDGASATTVEALANESNANPSLIISSGGYIGPFPANAPNTVCQFIGIDIVFPKGLSNNGTNYTVTVENQARPIDASGAALAGWTTLGTESITRNSLSPVRVSYKYARPDPLQNRWELRVRRTTTSPFNANIPDECDWAGMRAYLPSVGTYANVTLYAIRVKATEQIPADVARQINIIATRKLPIWNGTTWSAPTVTRSPAWALADILRNTLYGASLPENRIDLAKLLALDAIWAARGDYFDGVYDQTITVWETLLRTARAGRATPIVAGGMVTFVRDQARTVRTALYSPQHMKKGSLSIEYSFRQADDPDGIELAWIDPSTWRQAHIEATVDGSPAIRPASVDLFGVTDQAQAQREATYLARVNTYQRKVVRFATEMDGHIPQYGDLIGISHDVPAWGQSGALLSIAGTTYTTTEPLTWTPSSLHYVGLRKPGGSLSGPYAVTQVADNPNAFTLVGPLDFVPRLDLSSGDRTAYLFGPGSQWVQDVVVTKIMPRSETEVELTCQPYDSRIYAAGS